ncbi:MAG: hypothetical protein JSW27_09650 [Phycisphaerales bacterium]|nr:MAG: hypothetical protein JSW27_09650 [Phycisphaerales bacterium]
MNEQEPVGIAAIAARREGRRERGEISPLRPTAYGRDDSACEGGSPEGANILARKACGEASEIVVVTVYTYYH